MTGRRVEYELGEQPRDRYDRALVYVWVRGRLFNATLVSQGYATPLAIEPNDRFARRFELLARQARERRVGLWDACGA